LCGVALHRDVERGLVAERVRHLLRGGFAVIRNPAHQQPGRNVQHLRLHLFNETSALPRATAQYCIDEASIFRGAPVGLHQADREIDRGVIGHVHPEDLRSADQKRALRARRVSRNAAVKQPRQYIAERAQPSQHGRDQPPHQRAVAVSECLQSGMCARAVELIIECATSVEHAIHDIRGNSPRRKTGHFGGSR